jgi:AcrR family transcriptional regulator
MGLSARGRPRSSELDRRIIAAARAALVAGGYHELSMEAVARAAGVGKQTVYRRWPRRPLLVIDAVLAQRGRAGRGAGLPDTGSLAGDLAAVAAGVASAEQAAGPAVLRGLVADCLGDDALTQTLRARLLAPGLRAAALAAERAARRGELAPDVQPALVAEAVAGALLARLLLPPPRRPQPDLAFGASLARLVAEGATRRQG